MSTFLLLFQNPHKNVGRLGVGVAHIGSQVMYCIPLIYCLTYAQTKCDLCHRRT